MKFYFLQLRFFAAERIFFIPSSCSQIFRIFNAQNMCFENVKSPQWSCSAKKIDWNCKKQQNRSKIEVSVTSDPVFFIFGTLKTRTYRGVLLFLLFFPQSQLSGQSLRKSRFFTFSGKFSGKCGSWISLKIVMNKALV